jgi:hypothetical protein
MLRACGQVLVGAAGVNGTRGNVVGGEGRKEKTEGG